MRVTICQMSSGEDRELNATSALNLLDRAASDRADIAVLPECLDYLGLKTDLSDSAEHIDGPLAQAIAAKARDHNMWIVAGTMRVKDDNGRIVNALSVYNREGQRTALYCKTHLFDVCVPGEIEFFESKTITAGSSVTLTEIEGVLCGLAICYDVRFPEIFRLHAMRGAKIIFVPAAFTTFTGKDHWEVLLRARAIENQCYIVAPDQIGTPVPGLSLYGRSMIIDPWGTVIGAISDRVGIVTVDLDMDHLETVRRKLPALTHRREDVYQLSTMEG